MAEVPMEFVCGCGRRWQRTLGMWLKCECGATHRPITVREPRHVAFSGERRSTVVDPGHVAFYTCQTCGASVLVDQYDTAARLLQHIRWHEDLDRRVDEYDDLDQRSAF